MIWVGGFLSSGKFKLHFVRGQPKAADYVNMLNELSIATEGRRLCGEEWIFQQNNATIHNASITKKYWLEQRIRFLDHPPCSPDLNSMENLLELIIAKVYEGDQPYSAIFELKNAILDAWENIYIYNFFMFAYFYTFKLYHSTCENK